MNKSSYLLAIDGSVESRAAAFLAWCLAKKTGARVTAQHVVNVRDTWRFLKPKSAGFIGSGPYMEAFQCVTEGLRSVAEALMSAYRTQVEGQNIDFATYIDEGDLVSEICKRAKEHDLLIIGHRATVKNKQAYDYSLCDELAGVCPCPMLLVSTACNDWNKLSIKIRHTKVDPATIEKLSKFGKLLDLPLQLHISASISQADIKLFLSALSLCPDFNTWDIYIDSMNSKENVSGELPVIMPGLDGYAPGDITGLRNEIHLSSSPAVLVWNKQLNGKPSITRKVEQRSA